MSFAKQVKSNLKHSMLGGREGVDGECTTMSWSGSSEVACMCALAHFCMRGGRLGGAG